MIKKEILDKKFVRHYSDSNKYIRKVGTDEEYCEAIDLISNNYQYEETEKEMEDGKSSI